MGQWGEVKKENDCKFVLHTETNAFASVKASSIVGAICFLDAASDFKMAEIKEKYIGKKYGEII